MWRPVMEPGSGLLAPGVHRFLTAVRRKKHSTVRKHLYITSTQSSPPACHPEYALSRSALHSCLLIGIKAQRPACVTEEEIALQLLIEYFAVVVFVYYDEISCH